MPNTLLLVDDSPTIRSIIKVYLMGLPLQFIEAENSDKALASLKASAVQLVIADVNMPGSMNGIDLVRQIRAHPSEAVRKLPVILLTGEKGEEIRARGREAGANEFIGKPVSNAQLRDAITRLLKL